MNIYSKTTNHIKVFARCRPLEKHEIGAIMEIDEEAGEVKVTSAQHDTRTFVLDHIFPEKSTQIDVYMTVVNPLVHQVIQGFNCTVFAYGPTGTGKTFTMEGEKLDCITDWKADNSAGIIPRAISQLFEALECLRAEFKIKVSFLELYNEEAYDLMSPPDDTTKLKIYDIGQRQGSVMIDGLRQIVVQSRNDIYEILQQGSNKRQIAATRLNACSSRSHTIFTITLDTCTDTNEGRLIKSGKINLIDLAGSENIGRSGACDMRAREAGSINQSLLTLSRVIQALVDKAPHVPYRESKLTRILQDSLGGTTKTSIIATISPALMDLEHTLNTLDYASRAKRVTNKPVVNRHLEKKITVEHDSDLVFESYLDLKKHYERMLCVREYEIRNEVSLEFRRETENMRTLYEESHRKHVEELREQNEKHWENANSKFQKNKEELQSKINHLEKTAKELQEIISQNEVLRAQLNDKIICLEQEAADSQANIHKLESTNSEYKTKINKLEETIVEKDKKIDYYHEKVISKELALTSAEEQIKSLMDMLDSATQQLQKQVTPEPKHDPAPEPEPDSVTPQSSPTVTPHIITDKKATRVRKTLLNTSCDYANMTFDNDDDELVPDTKKSRKKIVPGARKRTINPAITLSGKKRKLLPQEDEVEISPMENKRMTRSRASRKKLVYP